MDIHDTLTAGGKREGTHCTYLADGRFAEQHEFDATAGLWSCICRIRHRVVMIPSLVLNWWVD